MCDAYLLPVLLFMLFLGMVIGNGIGELFQNETPVAKPTADPAR
jgi:hypothetical protein